MFTGLVQAIGKIASRRPKADVLELEVDCPSLAPELQVGASVAVSGVCLTATALSDRSFRVEVAEETIRRTRFGAIAVDEPVNLELPLRPSDRLGGHFVQGHVDEIGRVAKAGHRQGDYVLMIEHSPDASPLVVAKGSIAIDGVSLTVTECGRGWFGVMLIPHTLSVTTLGRLRAGDFVHLEYDILAKYMVRMTEVYRDPEKEESEDSQG